MWRGFPVACWHRDARFGRLRRSCENGAKPSSGAHSRDALAPPLDARVLPIVIVLPRCRQHRRRRRLTHIGCCHDPSPPCARSSCRREPVAVARLCRCRAPAQRDSRGPGEAFYRRGNGRHLRRLQGRRLSRHRQRQESLGRGEAAGLDLQDPEFDDRAGDRRGRRSRQGRLQVGRRRQEHRGLEQGPHHAHARSRPPRCRSIRRSPGASARSGCRNISICSNTATATSAAASTSSG